jgi:saccharopine dehydrogenase (NAD+, L-lysine-forming)
MFTVHGSSVIYGSGDHLTDFVMSRILLIGAGAQGGPCASILARDEDVSEIVLGDINLELAKKVSKKIGSEKITVAKLDASNSKKVERLARGVDAVINLTLTAFDMTIMKAALQSGAHYIDTSFGEPDLMDIRARDNILSQIIEKLPLTYDKEYREAGMTALLGCGVSPGTTNVIARYICDKMDQVEEIRIRYGGRALEESREVVKAWTPTWSPFRALWGYSIEPTVFEGGDYRKYPIFSGPEEYPFPEPVGPVLLSYHQHQEPISLPHFIGKGIRYCDFKYPVDALVGAFVKMGFGSPEPIDVNGVKVAPRDVLLKLVRPPVNSFLAEDEAGIRKPLDRLTLIVVEVKGTMSGRCATYSVVCPNSFYRTTEERHSVYNMLGTAITSVALPAVIGAKMCINGDADKGVICAECLDPEMFFKMATEMGSPVKINEVVTREVSY